MGSSIKSLHSESMCRLMWASLTGFSQIGQATIGFSMYVHGVVKMEWTLGRADFVGDAPSELGARFLGLQHVGVI